MPGALSDTSDFVVVGAGLAGAATAWQLAERGYQVTLLERSTPAAHDGSSHGSARIFRYAYPDPFYTRAAVESKALWDSLAAASAGIPLITPSGAVDYGRERNPRLLASVLVDEGIEHELLSAAEARTRWPQIFFDTEVLWHPGAGVIDAETAVHAMVGLAVGQGARLLTGWEVASVEPAGTGYRLRSSTGETVDAGNVVISAGGWLPELLGQLSLPAGFLARLPEIAVRQEQAFHFKYRDHDGGTRAPAAAWPTFIHKATDIQAYGLPGGRDAGFAGQKVAEYNGGKFIPSAAQQSGQVDPANRERVMEYVRRYLPGLNPEPYAETTCLFTNTPTEDFLIDRVENLTVLSPCSGHGAKFAPLIGQWASDLATGTGSIPNRFRTASSTAATT